MPAVLVVEDDPAMLYVIARQLKAFGIITIEAPNSVVALGILTQPDHGITVILTDVDMPLGVPDGITLAKLAQVRAPDIHVVYMTGYANVATKIRRDTPGALLFQKPLDFDGLAVTIFGLCQK